MFRAVSRSALDDELHDPAHDFPDVVRLVGQRIDPVGDRPERIFEQVVDQIDLPRIMTVQITHRNAGPFGDRRHGTVQNPVFADDLHGSLPDPIQFGHIHFLGHSFPSSLNNE